MDDDGTKKDFAFDYSFWSHDGFRNREDGYSEPEDDQYTDQRAVYNVVSIPLTPTKRLVYILKSITDASLLILSAAAG